MSETSTPTVHYRLGTEADLPVIRDMYLLLNEHFYKTGYRLPHPEDIGEAYLDSFRRTLGRYSNIWVAEIDGQPELPFRIVGYILCRVKRVPVYFGGVLVGELSDMWIVPEARRYGIGDCLSRLALEWLREQGVHSVEIQVLDANDASWRLFDRMGFKLEFRAARLLWNEYVDKPPQSS